MFSQTRTADPNVAVNPTLFSALRYRNVGPHRGGRVTAVSGDRTQPGTFYMGSTGGGVWKTTNYGQSWINVSDSSNFATASIGAIDLAPSDPNIVYAGTGSAAIRSNIIIGKGVYKSTDAGRTWSFVGLKETGAIGELLIHPQDPNIVYVAALGQIFGPNAERGVFRTKDGGRTWQKVLFINNDTGAVSLAINYSNPNEVYAGAWRGRRKPWTIVSGGPASEGGIYKTADGGDTWTHLTNGLPKDLIGKIDIDVSRANPQRVYAVLEAPGTQGGVYRSDDAGATFTQVSSDQRTIGRPFYYTYIDADPKNADTVYVNNLSFVKSTDGGKTWRNISTPHGDNHGMWINPDDPNLFIQSNDGGVNVTRDGGQTWSTQYNQSTAELYQVEVDNQFPYRLYGAQQDNSTVIVPSLPPAGGRPDDPIQLWMQGAGCETGPIKPKPDNPNIVYGVCKGEFYRLNLITGQEKNYWVHPQNRYGQNPRNMKYRFQRTSPFEVSPHNPNVVYMGSHFLHKTTDEGTTWEVISPDLTANESDKQVNSGEPITRDITGEEVYSTIYAIRESKLEPGVIWVGSNDGPVHVTRDGGKTWKNVTPPGLGPGGRVQQIESSPHRRGSAYVAIYRYLLDDFAPYIYLTNDYGATWKRLTDGRNGIPADFPTRVVREDPDREGLLYAGTEFGMFISFDNGAHWQSFQQNLPVTPITDIRVHRKDLVFSTMGRGFWIMDNLTPLHQITETVKNAPAHLFTPNEAYRMRYSPMGGVGEPEYPPAGARIDYYFPAAPAGEVTLEVVDSTGKVVRVFSSEGPGQLTTQVQEMRAPALERAGTPRMPKNAGMNRFVWDLRHHGAWAPGNQAGSGGPYAVPGRYQVRLKSGEFTQSRTFDLKIDPRVTADGITQRDLEEQFNLNIRTRDTLTQARLVVQRLQDTRNKLRGQPGAEATVRRLTELESLLVNAPGVYPAEMLLSQLQSINRMTSAADQKVGRSAIEYLEELRRELAKIAEEVQKIAETGSR